MPTKTKRAAKQLPVGEQPVIDLSEMTYEEAMNMAILEAKIQRLGILQARLASGDETTAVLDELLMYSSPAMMEEVFNSVRNQMAKVVRSLPGDWFTPDTPPNLSLRDANTYRWLRADRAKQLRTLIQRAQQDASKNSEGG